MLIALPRDPLCVQWPLQHHTPASSSCACRIIDTNETASDKMSVRSLSLDKIQCKLVTIKQSGPQSCAADWQIHSLNMMSKSVASLWLLQLHAVSIIA